MLQVSAFIHTHINKTRSKLGDGACTRTQGGGLLMLAVWKAKRQVAQSDQSSRYRAPGPELTGSVEADCMWIFAD